MHSRLSTTLATSFNVTAPALDVSVGNPEQANNLATVVKSMVEREEIEISVLRFYEVIWLMA